MLGVGSYLVGIAHLALVAGFATLGADALRSRLVPMLSGAPAHLATIVLALGLLIVTAELLGTFGLFEPLVYGAAVVTVGGSLWVLLPRVAPGWDGLRRPEAAQGKVSSQNQLDPGPRSSAQGKECARPGDRTRGRAPSAVTVVALLIAAAAFVHFALEAKVRLGTGMTGFDSTWYHAPFAAGFFQSGDTWDLHFIAPQFFAWFYPANSELFHAIGMQAFDRDLLSPLLNLGWFAGCLLALWCIGRPFGVAPFSLALGAIALSVPALADQAGEARNDIVGIFFLLAAVAIALNAQAPNGGAEGSTGGRLSSRYAGTTSTTIPVLALTGLAAGLAAGTKLNFMLPAAVLVVGLPLLAPSGARGRALLATFAPALAGGGYWYLRNLAHSGNPLPWVDGIGSLSFPAPDQALGGREGHSVLEYLTNGAVWSDWLLPGLADGLTVLWPLPVAVAFAGLVLSLGRHAGRGGAQVHAARPALWIAGLVGLAAAAAWLIAPTSASGPEGMPRGFESGLRYLAPAIVLGLALLPTTPVLRRRLGALAGTRSPLVSHTDTRSERADPWRTHRTAIGLTAAVLAMTVAVGYSVQRHYLESRYADPAFTTPGLNAAFGWSRDVTGARIATTSTRQFPLFGLDLSNRVDYVGIERPHGGFVAPSSCRSWLRLLAEGEYDYVVASRDRIEPGKPPYPPSAAWTAATGAEVVLREPPTVVFKLKGGLDPSACR